MLGDIQGIGIFDVSDASCGILDQDEGDAVLLEQDAAVDVSHDSESGARASRARGCVPRIRRLGAYLVPHTPLVVAGEFESIVDERRWTFRSVCRDRDAADRVSNDVL